MKLLKANITAPIEFISGGQFESGAPWIHSRRTIDSFEMIIGVKETLYIEQENVQYAVKPGDMLLLLPNRIHQGCAPSRKGLSFYWFHFICPGEHHIADVQTVADEIRLLQTDPEAHRFNTSVYIPLYFKSPTIERINIIFQQLQHLNNSNYSTRFGVHYFLTSLLIELSEQAIAGFHPATARPRRDEDNTMARIAEWVRIHASEPISVTEIADKFSYNKDYLSRCFKRKTGMNLLEYIHVLRISKAKDLLFRTTQSIKEISYSVGIRDEKYFMKLFKKYEKITPTDFRKAYYMTHMNKE